MDLTGFLSSLTDGEAEDYQKMAAQIGSVERRNRERFHYYDAEHGFQNMGVAIPERFVEFASILGWNGTAVDALARRIKLRGLVRGDDPDSFAPAMDLAQSAGLHGQFRQAKQSALIYGVSFIATMRHGTRVFSRACSARDATGLWHDDVPGKLRAGMAVAGRRDGLDSKLYLFHPGKTIMAVRRRDMSWDVSERRFRGDDIRFEPVRYLPDLDKPWGQSRITRPMMSLTRSAARSFLRGELNGEFYSYPQLYGLNINPDDVEFLSTMGKFFALDYERDEDGAPVKDAPPASIGQVQVGTQQPHMDQLRATAMLYAAESALSPDKLGVIHDNPSSADAIDRADGELNATAEDATDDMGNSVLNCVSSLWLEATGNAELDDDMRRLSCEWHDPGLTTRYSQRASISNMAANGLAAPDNEITYLAAGMSPTMARRFASAVRERELRTALPSIVEKARQARDAREGA